jgi:hypothetical protein
LFTADKAEENSPIGAFLGPATILARDNHKLPDVCPKDYKQLEQGTRRVLRRMRRLPTLIAAFWKQASLFE